jgi:pyrophosphatase PpaX
VLRAALFDFDGTLVDTTELIYRSMRHATRTVLGEDLPREVLMRGVGQPLPQQMERLAEGYPEAVSRAEALLETYRLHNDEHHEALIEEFPGVEEALSRLRSAGIELAVVTSKRRRSVEMAIETFPALGKIVDHFVTMEETTEHKPHPAPLLKGLELLGGVPVEEAAYVGDSPHDVAAARAAGVMCVAVSWGAFSEAELRVAGPDHLVPDLDAAVDVLLRAAGRE